MKRRFRVECEMDSRPRKGVRRFFSPIAIVATAVIVATSGVAYAFWTTSATGSGQAQAITLGTPGAGSTSSATTSSLTISWGASSGLPSGAGYIVLRGPSNAGPFTAISDGSCNQSTTGGSMATTCVDNDSSLTPGTTYFYEVEASYVPAPLDLWKSPTNVAFSGSTTGTAPSFTSSNSTSFTAGTAGSFPVTTSGTPAVNSITNANFGTCAKSTLPAGVALSYTSGSTATIVSTTSSPAGTYTFCLNASNGVSPNATQQFTLSISSTATKLVLTAENTTTNAGSGDGLTITAEDAGGNTVTSYTGSKNLTFGGASVSPNGTHPTVTNGSGTAINFGSTTAITFTNGVAQVSGSNNGLMTLYDAQTTSITVSDGTINNGTGLSVTVLSLDALSFVSGCPVHVKNTTYSSKVSRTNTADIYGNNPWSTSVTLTFDSSAPAGASWSNPTGSGTIAGSTGTSSTANAWTPPNGNYGAGQFSVSGGLYQPASCSFTAQ